MRDRVLVIDDDDSLLTLLTMGLERAGYDVITASSAREGLHKAYELHPDAVVLDIMMPDMDGWATCQRLRQVSGMPIIMLTAIADKDSVVKGLALGADDYVSKPCSFDELKARIRSAIRRTDRVRRQEPDTVIDDGNLRVDIIGQTVSRKGRTVNLTPTESRLLFYLASRRDDIVPHRELLVNVWGPEYADEVKYLGVYIRYLRKKIEDNPSKPLYIITKHRVGYCFTTRKDTQT